MTASHKPSIVVIYQQKNCKIVKALLPPSHSGLLSVLWVPSYYPSSLECLSLLAGWCQTDYILITQMCKCTCMRTHPLELMKIQPHLGLSNGPNNRESLGALRVSGRLQDAHGLDGQVVGSDTPTLIHPNTHNAHLWVELISRGATTSLTTRRQGWALPNWDKKPLKLLITGWNVGSSITHMTYPIAMLFYWATDHVMHTYCYISPYCQHIALIKFELLFEMTVNISCEKVTQPT